MTTTQTMPHVRVSSLKDLPDGSHFFMDGDIWRAVGYRDGLPVIIVVYSSEGNRPAGRAYTVANDQPVEPLVCFENRMHYPVQMGISFPDGPGGIAMPTIFYESLRPERLTPQDDHALQRIVNMRQLPMF